MSVSRRGVFSPMLALALLSLGPGVEAADTAVDRRAAVRARCEAAFRQAKTSSATISERGVIVTGDGAIEHGKFEWSLIPIAGGSPERDQGNFVVIWHRQPDGSWRVTRDIWNSSQPLSGAR